ncbi:MAG: metal-sulfur cluster assembly factor [Spirochaetales bacterium]|nr:metal-sulfur cluster assembly factor [Spirochaetales bacterium]
MVPVEENEQWQEAWKNLAEIEDPELGISITELGLVYELRIEEAKAFVKMTFTSMACPVGPQLVAMAEGAVRKAAGITDAEIEVVFSPPWNPRDMASEEAQLMLGII